MEQDVTTDPVEIGLLGVQAQVASAHWSPSLRAAGVGGDGPAGAEEAGALARVVVPRTSACGGWSATRSPCPAPPPSPAPASTP